MGGLVVFAPFLPLLPLSLFFLPKCCLAEISVTTGWIVLKLGDMVDVDVKLCNRV